jgi:hypothetical protein
LYRLGLKASRLDFWNLPNEMTQYELAVHRVLDELEPSGAERDDLRAAWVASHQIASQAAEDIDPEEMKKLFQNLLDYTKYLEPPADDGRKAALERMKEKSGE